MDVVITGRHCQIPDEFRTRVEEKIAAVEKLKDRVIRVEVQVSAHGSRRQPGESTQVEITLRGRGPVVRAEASAEEKGAAFDRAMDRLMAQLRRASDRRKTHRGLRGQGHADEFALFAEGAVVADDRPEVRNVAGLEVTGDGPLVVREKHFDAVPLTLAQALDEMELVGHDFFLYVDAETGAPSAVYRRKAYDYGVIHLDMEDVAAAASA
jgi:ribosomal subunit interface protein